MNSFSFEENLRPALLVNIESVLRLQSEYGNDFMLK